MVLDIGHAHTCGTLQDFLAHPALTHVHLHDNSGEGDEHLALGKGRIDLMPVLQKIQDKGLTAALEQKSEIAVIESLTALKTLQKSQAPLILSPSKTRL